MTIYSGTLHWLDITLIVDPVTDLELITEFDFLTNCASIEHLQQVPTEDAYSSGHLVLSHFVTCMYFNVETNLS